MDKIAIELSKLPFIETINALKAEIDGYRPFPKDVEERIFQTLRLRWNYESNAIEGNKYTYGETVTLIMEGLTAFGKTRKDADDIEGHNEALKYMLSLIKDERDFSETDIRDLHKIILVKPYKTKAKTLDGHPSTKTVNLGEYKKLPNHVETSSTGEIHYYATPEETPAMMTELMDWYNTNKENNEVHPLVLASLFHHKFVAIHPFDDGNGRLGRILMNLILMRKGFPPIIVKNDDKLNYYNVLNLANRNLYQPLVEYMGDLLGHSLNIYLKGIKGENIEEEGDIDKEIALFKKSIFNKDILLNNDKTKSLPIIYNQTILKLHKTLFDKSAQFDELFLNNTKILLKSGIIRGKMFSDESKSEFIERFPGIRDEFIGDETIINGIDKIRIFFLWNTPKVISINDKRYTLDISFDFLENEYHINYNKKIIKKKYFEIISDLEVNEIINETIKRLIVELKQTY